MTLGQPRDLRVAIERVIDAVVGAVGLVHADDEAAFWLQSAVNSGRRQARVAIEQDADMPGPVGALVDRREGVDADQRDRSATRLAMHGVRDGGMERLVDRLDTPSPLGLGEIQHCPARRCPRSTAGIESNIAGSRLQSMTSRDMPHATERRIEVRATARAIRRARRDPRRYAGRDRPRAGRGRRVSARNMIGGMVADDDARPAPLQFSTDTHRLCAAWQRTSRRRP